MRIFRRSKTEIPSVNEMIPDILRRHGARGGCGDPMGIVMPSDLAAHPAKTAIHALPCGIRPDSDHQIEEAIGVFLPRITAHLRRPPFLLEYLSSILEKSPISDTSDESRSVMTLSRKIPLVLFASSEGPR